MQVTNQKILTIARLIDTDYMPKNGKGYKLADGETYMIRYYLPDMTFEVVYG